MSPNEKSSSPGKPNRGPLIAIAAVGAVLLIAFGALSIWLVMHLLYQPEQTVIVPQATGSGSGVVQSAANAVTFAQVRFTPGPGDLHGRVLAADGTPLNLATVFVALPGPSNLRIRNGKIGFENSGPAGFTHFTTGPDGQYDLPAQTGKFVIAAITDAGYAQLDQDAVAKNADLQLTAWGTIKGRVMVGTKPAVGTKLHAFAIDPSKTRAPVSISMANFAETDADGNFTLERVVPGPVQIARDVEERSGDHTWIYTVNLGKTDVAAGQTATVNLGGVGRPVVGKFVFPPGLTPTDYFFNARAFGSGSDPAAPDYYFLEVDEQNNFRVNNVIPGDYSINISLQKVSDRTRTRQPVPIKFTMPDVPGGVSDEPLVIPDIQLQ
jgi:hypothetical protein